MASITGIITGIWNTQIWCEDGNPRERYSTRAGVLYARPFKGETVVSFFEPSKIPAKWPEVAELKHICDVQFVISANRVQFTAPCTLTFDDVRVLCSCVSGKLPEHAHVMPAGRVVGGPDHIDFWHWAPRPGGGYEISHDLPSWISSFGCHRRRNEPGGGYEISHDLPSWETGEKASWDDEMCDAGDIVSLDFD